MYWYQEHGEREEEEEEDTKNMRISIYMHILILELQTVNIFINGTRLLIYFWYHDLTMFM